MRIERLTKRSDFGRVAKLRITCRRPAVGVQWAPRDEGVRVGFTASKRHVSTKAVCRNRAKRRLRAWVDGYLSLLNESGDFVFIATSLTATIPYAQLVEQCKEAVKRCVQKGHTLASKP